MTLGAGSGRRLDWVHWLNLRLWALERWGRILTRWEGGDVGWGGGFRRLGPPGGAVLTTGLTPTTFLRPQLALNIGNTRFNEVMEAQLPSHGGPKPSAESDM